MLIPDEPGFEAEGYEYNLEYLWNGEWRAFSTNRFDKNVWYPTMKSAKNALAQMRASRYGYQTNYEYRMIKRPYGASEVVRDV